MPRGRPPDAATRRKNPGMGYNSPMREFPVVVEKCPRTGLYVGHVPGFPGAHSTGETLEELTGNMREVVGMLLEDGPPELDSEFIGVRQVAVSA